MRISDWSSDVFSSDLLTRVETRALIEHIENMICAIRLPLLPDCAAALPGSPLPAGHPAATPAAGWRAAMRGSTQRSVAGWRRGGRSEEHTSELQSLMRISYAVFCLKKKKRIHNDQKLHGAV